LELTRPKVLALVLAGGEGGRLGVLTEQRAKPALPYGGVYRLIDFALSNCRHSGISDVWVIQQYEAHSLTEHLANGRPWDLDRTHGGLRVLHPHQGRSESGFYTGNADALFRHKADIERFGAELLVVLSADHVYKLDFGRALATHLERDAEATLVTTRVAREEAGRFGVVEVGDNGAVTGYAYKPDEPTSDLATTEVFVFSADRLLELLEELGDAEAEDSGVSDLGDEILPRLVAGGRVVEHRLEAHWRDVGTIESYWEGHMELLGPEPPLDFDDREWPILTRADGRPPARVAGSASVEAALLSPGCDVRGTVVHSVLAPGVRVEEGAEVRDSVVLEDVVVASRARVERALVDERAQVGAGARVGEMGGEITVVGRRARVEEVATISAGDEVQPGDA
jgi:glucose-1-phosphate adenylyltransferase